MRASLTMKKPRIDFNAARPKDGVINKTSSSTGSTGSSDTGTSS